MYKSQDFYKDTDGHFAIKIKADSAFKILQLTDMHLGFGVLSHRQDKLAMNAVRDVVSKARADMLVVTGDSIFPFLPKSGTLNNVKQARRLTAFLDSFELPYAIIFGNHDVELGAHADKDQIADIFSKGQYCIFDRGPRDIFGLGNYIIKLVDKAGLPITALVMLDSNMYGKGWFFSGFDCIHQDQTSWCTAELTKMQLQNNTLSAAAFFHMPLAEYKIAYEQMKLGDRSVVYNFGSIAETNDYFGISKNECDFFEKALANGCIKAMFCGHDHLNTLSLSYRGIMLTYGMSIDYLGYSKMAKRYSQRGGTLIEIGQNGDITASPVPHSSVVSVRVRGA